MGIDTLEHMQAVQAAHPEGGATAPFDQLIGKVRDLLYQRATGEMVHTHDIVLKFRDQKGHTADVDIPIGELTAIDRDLWWDVEAPLEEQSVPHQISAELTKQGFDLDDPTLPDTTVEITDKAT